MSLLIARPALALLPAAVFVGLFVFSRKRLPGSTAVAWTGYALYESLMKARVLCSGECNIRVDLLLLYPVLGILSLAAVISSLKRPSSPR